MMTQIALPSRIPDAIPVDTPSIRLHAPAMRSLPAPEFVAPAVAPGIKPLVYLKYRWVMVLFLGSLLGTALAAAAWNIIPSKYATYSLVRVYSTDPVLHAKEDVQGRNDFAIYLKSQAAMIKSNFVLTSALRDPNVAALQMLREQPDPVRFLEEELRVEYQEGSEILKILLSGDDPRAISQIVNSIQEAYFREVVDEEILRKKSRLRLLEDSITRMQDEVKRRHDQIKQAGIGTPAADAVPGLSAHLAANQLIRLRETLGKIESDTNSWENQKKTLEKKLANPADEVPALPAGYVDSLDNDARMQVIKKKIDSMNTKLEYLVKLSNDPNLASVVEIRQKIADAQHEREQFRKERVDELQKSQVPIVEKRLKAELEQCTHFLSQLAVQKTRAEEAIAEYQKTLANSGVGGEAEADFPKIDVRERTKIITEMLDKANLLRLEVNAPKRVNDFQRASVPMKKDMKKQILGTIVAGLLGFGLVGLGVVFHEARVRRALSLADVQKHVLGPLAGVWPARSNNLQQPFNDAVEKTRTQLFQQFSGPGGKLVAITSALKEEGKGYLAWQLAESCALAGHSTLLVDFDLRTPTLHRWMKVENAKGLCDVLAGRATLQQVLVPQPNGLNFIPAGPWSGDVRAGLRHERLTAFLDALRQQCDVVIVNTHPLLNVAETFQLCRLADGILLSVERQETRLPLAARAHEKLATVGSEAFGMVYQGATPEECLH